MDIVTKKDCEMIPLNSRVGSDLVFIKRFFKFSKFLVVLLRIFVCTVELSVKNRFTSFLESAPACLQFEGTLLNRSEKNWEKFYFQVVVNASFFMQEMLQENAVRISARMQRCGRVGANVCNFKLKQSPVVY
jgi:hypothetical protein